MEIWQGPAPFAHYEHCCCWCFCFAFVSNIVVVGVAVFVFVVVVVVIAPTGPVPEKGIVAGLAPIVVLRTPRA